MNNVAMNTLKIVYPSIVDVGCFSHTLDHVGSRFNTSTLSGFITLWINLFSHSPKTRLLWKTRTERSMSSYSATRWWSKWEVIEQVMLYFGDIEPFLLENEDMHWSSSSAKASSFFLNFRLSLSYKWR